MNLTVDRSLLLVVLGPGHVLILHGGVGGLVDGGVLGSVLVEETLNSCLGLVHDEGDGEMGGDMEGVKIVGWKVLMFDVYVAMG